MKKFLVAFVATIILALALPVRAEEAPTPCVTAEECTQQGEEAYLAGRYSEAEPLFREALRLEPQNIYYELSLAQTLEGIGECPSLSRAREIYVRLSESTGAAPATAREGLSRIAEAVAVCEEEVTVPPPPQTETSPTTEREPTSAPIPVEAEPSSRSRGGEIAGWTLLGVGGASVIASVIFYGLSWATAEERDEQCGRYCLSQQDSDDWLEADGNRQTLGVAGDILMFTGVAIAAAGLIWALVMRHRHRHRETPTTTVSLRPSPGGLILHW